jgi:hypothetical protein
LDSLDAYIRIVGFNLGHYIQDYGCTVVGFTIARAIYKQLASKRDHPLFPLEPIIRDVLLKNDQISKDKKKKIKILSLSHIYQTIITSILSGQ